MFIAIKAGRGTTPIKVVSLALAIAIFGCGGGGSSNHGTIVGPEGPTPIHGLVVASGLNGPMMYIANPVDKTLGYVLERSGRIRVLVKDVLQANSLLDLTGTVDTTDECGLLGMAFDPQFASNHYAYLHYDAGAPLESRIVRYTLDATGLTASSPYPILSFQQTSFANHKGGSLNFGRDGFLYLGFGDGGSSNDPNSYAQDPAVFFGKMLRIDPRKDDFPGDPNQNYGIPSSNPWTGVAGVRGEIWDFGLRNPFRWCFDPVTGGMLIGDVGQDAYEEVNFEPASKGHRNYGWRIREGQHDSGNSGSAFFTPVTDPFFDYPHSVGECVIGGFVYRGTGLGSALRGRYFFADYVTGKLWSIPFALGSGGEAKATTQSEAYDHTSTINATLAGNALSGPTSVNPDANGEIMVCDLNQGTLVRLVK